MFCLGLTARCDVDLKVSSPSEGLNRSQGPVWFCFRWFFPPSFSHGSGVQNFWPVLGLCCKPVQVQVLDQSWQHPCSSSARTNETWRWSESRFWSWAAADVWVLLVWSDPTTKTDFQQQFVRFLQEEPELNGSDCNARTSRTKELLGNPTWAARCYLSRVKWADPGPETKEAPGGHRRGKTPCSPSSGPH